MYRLKHQKHNFFSIISQLALLISWMPLCAEVRYTIEEIPPIEGYMHSLSVDINDAGWVVGHLLGNQEIEHKGSFLWHAQHGMYLIKPFLQLNEYDSLYDTICTLAQLNIVAFHLDEACQVVGYIKKINEPQLQAFIWDQKKGLRTLPFKPKHQSCAYRFCPNRAVIGVVAEENGKNMQGFIWQDDELDYQALHTIPLAVNKNGQMVILDANKQLFFLDAFSSHWIPLPLSFEVEDNNSLVLNEEGIIAGTYQNCSFIWSMQKELCCLPESFHMKGINKKCQLVGCRAGRACFYETSQGLVDLQRLIDPSAGWQSLDQAESINNQGQIVGWGRKAGKIRGFLLTPVPL